MIKEYVTFYKLTFISKLSQILYQGNINFFKGFVRRAFYSASGKISLYDSLIGKLPTSDFFDIFGFVLNV